MKAIIHLIFRVVTMNRSLVAYVIFSIAVSVLGVYHPLTKTSFFSSPYDTSWNALGPGDHSSQKRLYRRGFSPRSYYSNHFHK